MKLTDFRQFYGESEFTFGTDKKNITLIIGANGNGKTGIFRALMFVLYGDTTLKQDNKTTDIHLVNLNKLEENQHSPVKASVELNFEFNDQEFVIKRSITSIKEDNKISNRVQDPKLFIFSENGDFIPYTKENIDVFIKRIIEPEIREFFFFDAERMDLLDTTKSEKSLTKDVQEGIIRLLQIKYLEESTTEISRIMKEKQTEINRQVRDEEIDNKINSKNEIENSILETEQSLMNYREEKRSLVNEMEEINEKLSDNSEIKDLQEKIMKENELLQAKEETRSFHKEHMKSMLKQGIHFNAKDILDKNELFFKEYMNDSSDKIPHALLEKTLHDLTCEVCRTNFEEDSSQYLSVQKLLEEYQSSSVTDVIRNLLKTQNKLDLNEKTFIIETEDQIRKLVENKEDIETSEIEINQLNELIGDKAANIENLNRLEKQLSTYSEDGERLNENIATAEYTLEKLKLDLNVLEKEIDKLTEKYSRVKKDRAIKEKLEQFRSVLEETIYDYSSSITKELSHDIYQTFIMLLDKKDRNNYKEVVITENFEIKLQNQLDQNVVQDLSMGQGQIFSLSFILSLAKIASKGRSEINFPLFMDTPFARLSRDNRNNLIENVPALTNQWILLLTDTEFTDTENELFEKFGQVGKIYVLDNAGGKTTPKSYNILHELEMEVY